MSGGQLIAAVIAILAILVPIASAILYRVRQLEIKVMNGLSDDMSDMKDELKLVTREMHNLKILVVKQIEGGG